MNTTYAALMLPALFALIFLGVPVAYALIGTAFAFGILFSGDLIGLQLFRFIQSVAANYVLVAVALFVFMGAMLERSGVAEKLFIAMRIALGRLHGGLALATITMCAIFAAGTGIVGAVEVLVGLMAIRPMMRYGYDRSLIAGTICAGGSLGTMIPPSIVVVIYATQAQVGIGDLLTAVMLPGLVMVVLFLLYIYGRARLRPQDGPPLPADDEALQLPFGRKLALIATALVPTLGLITAVIGSIMLGIASPTEAAGVGALGTILLAILYRKFSLSVLVEAVKTTLAINGMIILIVLGGTMFTAIFLSNGGAQMVQGFVAWAGLERGEVVVLFMVLLFLGGFVLDWVSLVLILVPIFYPMLQTTGFDPIWIATIAVIVIQTSYLTPPMAPSIFYLRGIAPPEMTYGEMCRGVLPFIVCQLLTLATVVAFPKLATWLPSVVKAF